MTKEVFSNTPKSEYQFTDEQWAYVIKFLLPAIFATLLSITQETKTAHAQIWPDNLRPGAGPFAKPNPYDKREPWYKQQPDTAPLPKPESKLKTKVGAYINQWDEELYYKLRLKDPPVPSPASKRDLEIWRNQQAWELYENNKKVRREERLANMQERFREQMPRFSRRH